MNKTPQKAKRPCLSSGCKDFATNKGYCDKHQSRVKQRDRDRGTAHQRGYDAKWNYAREAYLAEHPLCVECSKRGYIVPATIVDHIIPHKGDKALFWDQTNWQPLCESHHNSKTASEDRGAWIPAANKPKPDPERTNPYKIGDNLVIANDAMQSRLNCDDQTHWEVLDVINEKILEVSNGMKIHQLHYSHFKAVSP
ncbi:HNH endonuclease signature motif containing protein [Acinetobacter ursingii]|uniref:HNH endonuclease signature motif containing protein n=1 Tax=Acinetobacter ursingii TaxID=108980 RepID=UPI00124D20D9|nr:HNH endonuclease signature motif containing protein [Acinetobacter ursingii]